MAALLQSVARTTNPRDMPFFLNEERARLIRADMDQTPDPERKSVLWLHAAVELLNAGKTDEALKEIAALEEYDKRVDPLLWAESKAEILRIANSFPARTDGRCRIPIPPRYLTAGCRPFVRQTLRRA